ncbi:Peptidase family M50 [Planctomycetes bacterium CA13]|uniref:Peptidase family M50 n=1 Tax=Novipirellula herctigrandis TaxID=2527986 RepID=A0A5C5Z6N2_9BACT|nr:Peptidase family M50 [Planctomycetes bacterium CA13]
MLQEPPESQYDLRFEIFGFPVRVAWSFWLGAVIFGYSLVDLLDRVGADSPGRLPLLMLWCVCMLVSILIHELGHAFAFRQYGINASIVLYHFGGLAIPSSSFTPGRSFSRLSEKQDLWIALAGPLAQIVSAFVLIGALKVLGLGFSEGQFFLVDLAMPLGLSRIFSVLDGEPIQSIGLYAMVLFYIFPSVLWALLNLVPVWPLDGGRIMNSVVLIGGGRRDQALWISVIAAGLLTAYGFKNGQTFLGILFLSLAISNYQVLQQNSTWRF